MWGFMSARSVLIGGCFLVVALVASGPGCSLDPRTFPGVQAGGGGTGGNNGGSCATECCGPEECPAPSNACIARTCEIGMCGTKNVEDGAPADLPAAACKVVVCDGNGGTRVENEDDGSFDDGKDCTVVSCSDGMPLTTPAALGTPCDDDGGAVCNDAAMCVQCNMESDCETTEKPFCIASTCVEPTCLDKRKNGTETDEDCGGNCAKCDDLKMCNTADDCKSGICENGTCTAKKGDGTTCASSNQCASGACVDGVCCNDACNGTCRACNPAGVCLLIAAGSDPANECSGNEACNGSGACGKAVGGSCSAAGDCAISPCVDGICCEVACNGTCKACSTAKTGQANGTCAYVTAGLDPDVECTGVTTCNGGGACTLLADGSACTLLDGSECGNGHCVDGFCCNTGCTGVCQACSTAKTGQANGTCQFVMTNADPDNECSGTDVCNGGGCARK